MKRRKDGRGVGAAVSLFVCLERAVSEPTLNTQNAVGVFYSRCARAGLVGAMVRSGEA